MGRLVAYLGPETVISSPVEGGSYSLARQADECPDGFGIGWYPADGDPDALRLASREPLRSATQLMEIPRRYRSSCVLAEVRSSEGAAELASIQPLARGPYLFAHEGTIDRFDSIFRRRLEAILSDEGFAALEGRSPSELLFALWLDALVGEGPDAMATALETVVSRVQEMATEADAPASFATVITDGRCLLALRTATHGPPPPLYTTVAEDRAPVPLSGRMIASEPTYPGSWQAIDAHALMLYTVEPEADVDRAPTEAPLPA